MTESTGSPYGSSQPGGDASTRDVAKDEAKGVAQDAAQAGKETVETAKQQAGEVVGEAATQAKALLDQAREQLTSQGSSQKERASSNLRSLADELSGIAQGSGAQPQGLAGDLVREAAQRVQTVADWLETREPSDVLADVRDFARRRPGVFLLSAAAIGFVGGRLTRSIAAEARDSSGDDRSVSGSGYATGSVGTGYADTGYAGTGSLGTGYADTGYADRTGLVDTGVPATADYTETAPAAPGYAVPPTGDTAGDATAQFTPTAPDTGLGEVSTDQMPSEFGARGTGAAGNRREEGTF